MSASRMPAAPSIRPVAVGTVVVAAAASVPSLLASSYSLGLANVALIYVLLVVGYNFTLGLAGQFTLAQIAFWAMGAYSSALLTTGSRHVAWPLAMIVGMLVASVSAVVLAGVTQRLRTHYLALATLAFGEITRIVLTNWSSLSGGVNGVSGIPALSFFGASASAPADTYYALLGFTVVGIAVAVAVHRGRFGRAVSAARQSEFAAQSIGLPVFRLRTAAFVLSAVYGAAAGSLYAQTNTFVSPDTFSFNVMVLVLAMLVVGGRGSVTGAVVGAVLLTLLPEWLRGVGPYYQLVYGVLLLVFVLVAPSGLVGTTQQLAAVLGRRLRGAQPAAPVAGPPPAATGSPVDPSQAPTSGRLHLAPGASAGSVWREPARAEPTREPGGG